MKTIIENFCDKTKWSEGEWTKEPDKKQWLDKKTGLPCLIVRNHALGFLCGYVGVDRHHPAYGQQYDKVEADCHGGLTYSGECGGHICHKAEEGEDDNIWWLGFDCGHGWDKIPYEIPFYKERGGNDYRNLAFVEKQCRKLAEQLYKMARVN